MKGGSDSVCHGRSVAGLTDRRDPRFIASLYSILHPALQYWFNPAVSGLERVPDGPAIYVGNHSGGMLMPDLFIFASALYERFEFGDLPFGLVHNTGIRTPGPRQLLLPLGGVDGSRENAMKLLEAGHKVWTYPGGELDLMRPYRHRDRIIFGSRRGYVRLAIRSGAPIIPFVSTGAHETFYIIDDGRWLAKLLGIERILGVKTWPILLCLPWGLWVGVPPPHFPLRSRIFTEVMEPIRFERTGEAAAADAGYVESCHLKVHGAMESALKNLAARRRAERKR
jgi:1-acyl-sn-glycerol-3-phosphate acyltransferase